MVNRVLQLEDLFRSLRSNIINSPFQNVKRLAKLITVTLSSSKMKVNKIVHILFIISVKSSNFSVFRYLKSLPFILVSYTLSDISD